MRKDIRQERRRHLRVRYPVDECPTAIINGGMVPVVELSRFGIVLHTPGAELSLRGSIEATLLFSDGTSLQVTGTVIRLAGRHTVVHLIHDIPEFRVLLERQYLGQRLLVRCHSDAAERRIHPRVRYASDECPYIIIGVKVFQVLEVSECGIVFRDQHNRFEARQAIIGILQFQDDTYVSIEGEVVRIATGRVVVQLAAGIPKERIAVERRGLGIPVFAKDMVERRKSPRVRYTEEDAPELHIKQIRYPVVEVSTRGLVLHTGDTRFEHGKIVLALLKYACGPQFLVHGTVVRRMRGFVVIGLDLEIPDAWVRAEQQRMAIRDVCFPGAKPATERSREVLGVDLRMLRQ